MMSLSKSKQRKKYMAAFVIAGLTFGCAVYYFNAPSAKNLAAVEPAAGGPAPAMQAMPVQVVEIKPQDVTIWKEFSGRLQAVEFADIRPQVTGTISEVRFEDGQAVDEGDILYVIDPRPYEAAADLAKANLKAAQNRLSLAEKELKRAKGLIETKAISKRILDERENERDVAAAAVDSAKAALEQADINLDYAYVKSPIKGRAGRVEIKKGNLVEAGPGAPMLTSVVANDRIYADFEVDERTYLDYVRSGARDRAEEIKIPVQMRLTNGGEEYEGVIYSFDNQLDVTSGTIRARALFMNADDALLPGMFVQVRLGSTTGGSKVLVNEKAIGTDQDRRFVYVVGDDNIVQYREVKLGDTIGENHVVLSGLEDGEKVITEGIIRIRPGMPVKPMMAEALPTSLMNPSQAVSGQEGS